jgi:hypothetical protein
MGQASSGSAPRFSAIPLRRLLFCCDNMSTIDNYITLKMVDVDKHRVYTDFTLFHWAPVMAAACLRETGGGARREASNADVQGGRPRASRTGKGRDPPGLQVNASPATAGRACSVIVGP